MNAPFDLAPQSEIARVLDSGESLIWSGAPRQGMLLRPNDAYMIPFSLLWGGFAIFWEVSVLRISGPNSAFMSLWGIPFVLIGLYMIVGRFFVDARIRAKTFYGLTDRRAIIVSGLFSRRINSLPLRTLTDISLQERSDRSGTILLGRPQPYSSWSSGMRWPGMSQYSAPAFEMIPNAKTVHDQLLEAQRAAA
jgi:Bacterial PH domain